MVSGRRLFRVVVAALFAAAFAPSLLGLAQAHGNPVLLLEVNGVINPITEGFIARGIKEAEKRGAHVAIISLDTPGGLGDSTRKITQHLLNAQVPTVVYVTPRGARAASAGTFIAAAANFAVMAPGTNIGAASPVAAGGQDLPETLKSKATQDFAAEMRSIAALRGRNVEKLEATVLQARSFTADEAVQLRMVDFIANDLQDLLAQLHGREAQLQPPQGRRVTLDTQNAAVQPLKMSFVERMLRFLADPNVSYLLLTLGAIGLMVELWNPGLVFPGVVGGILLILGLVVVGNLPVNWAGVALILLAAVLGVLEVHVSGFGILGVGAIVSFILGSLFLFFHSGLPSPTMPAVHVSLWVMAPVVLVLALGGGWMVVTMFRARRGIPEMAPLSPMGATGYATTNLAPRGTVQVGSELWTAQAVEGQAIREGEAVEVVEQAGLILRVKKKGE